jgi:hypothetical protein
MDLEQISCRYRGRTSNDKGKNKQQQRQEQATTKARTSNDKGKNKQQQRPMQGFFTAFRMTASVVRSE